MVLISVLPRLLTPVIAREGNPVSVGLFVWPGMCSSFKMLKLEPLTSSKVLKRSRLYETRSSFSIVAETRRVYVAVTFCWRRGRRVTKYGFGLTGNVGRFNVSMP